jgi:hypothetical protein
MAPLSLIFFNVPSCAAAGAAQTADATRARNNLDMRLMAFSRLEVFEAGFSAMKSARTAESRRSI